MYDEEGSSSIFSSETYRGPAAASEAETQAMKGLLDRIGFAFQVNYHSVGEWLLYAEGWQIGTPTADDPIYYALSGQPGQPGDPGLPPRPELRRPLRDERRDDGLRARRHRRARVDARARRRLPGLGLRLRLPGQRGGGPEGVRAQPAVRALGREVGGGPGRPGVLARASRPSRSTSRATTRTRRASRGRTSRSSTPTATRRRCRCWRSGASARSRSSTASTAGGSAAPRPREWRGGDRYDPADVYYRVMRGFVRGTDPATRSRSGSRPTTAVAVTMTTTMTMTTTIGVVAAATTMTTMTTAVAARDDDEVAPTRSRTRPCPTRTTTCSSWPPRTTPARRRRRRGGPHYVDYYVDAIEANGSDADVYDIDARGRTAPDQLGVLSHYDAVIWYTGDDVVTRRAGWGPGNADRLAHGQDPRGARVHERGRPRALHRQERRPAVLRRRCRVAAL